MTLTMSSNLSLPSLTPGDVYNQSETKESTTVHDDASHAFSEDFDDWEAYALWLFTTSSLILAESCVG